MSNGEISVYASVWNAKLAEIERLGAELAKRDAEVQRLTGALREARPYVRLCMEGDALVDRIDALLSPAPPAATPPMHATCAGGCGATKYELISNGHRPGCKFAHLDEAAPPAATPHAQEWCANEDCRHDYAAHDGADCCLCLCDGWVAAASPPVGAPDGATRGDPEANKAHYWRKRWREMYEAMRGERDAEREISTGWENKFYDMETERDAARSSLAEREREVARLHNRIDAMCKADDVSRDEEYFREKYRGLKAELEKCEEAHRRHAASGSKKHEQWNALVAERDAANAQCAAMREALGRFRAATLPRGFDSVSLREADALAVAALAPDAGKALLDRLAAAEDALTTWGTSGDEERFRRKVDAWRAARESRGAK